MATKRDYEQLAKLKQKEREIKEMISKIQTKIMKNSPEKEYIANVGVLKLKSRKNEAVQNNLTLIKVSSITKDIFIASASITPAAVKKVVGETEYETLKKKGVITEKEPSQYYEFKEHPTRNQEQLTK